MDLDGVVEIDAKLLDEIRSFAALKNIGIEDYLTHLIEEEILKMEKLLMSSWKLMKRF